ncbi:VOC family protein [Nonomuraea angiospora]|uniref:VOC family protein n=1 Tax=Nonomuraea angiospora TaxID=46172 RepID=UPI0029B900E2|nr:VOC family protein [Nonomuraea angiospora]MDX3101411.1 VOC family protein [Nonomuraea angiospora]
MTGFRWSTVCLDALDAPTLAAFYRELLGWRVKEDEPEWVLLAPPEGGPGLAFQSDPGFVRPVWPTSPGEQGMMMHLDIEVDDLDASSARAVELGATVADFQPQDDVRVHFDPSGHPFCLWVSG